MVSRVLVALDGSPQSTAALEYALAEFPEADIAVLHIIDPVEAGQSAKPKLPVSSEEWYENAKAEAEDLFADATALADEHDRDIETLTEVGRPTRTIVETADDEAFDQIVMGSHGRSGVSRILLGSVAEAVVRRASVPVTVVR